MYAWGPIPEEDHLIRLGEFFAVCQENHTRLKLEKCEFMRETMQYLGSDVGYGWWTPAASKANPLMDAKVRHEDPKKGLHDVRSFIGACNFYRCHIKNFTYTSAILTDLCCGLFLGNSTVPLVSGKSQNTTNLFCAGSLDGAQKITQSRRHKPHSQLAFDASLLFTDCQRDCDCDLRLARCCAAAVRSHNTTPPLRPRRGLIHLGGRHNVECRAGPEKNFGPRHVLATEA